MRVSLMTNPWAAQAAHMIEADSPEEWRAAIASIPNARYSAAIWLDDSGRPYPVQRFHGADWPKPVVSSDGFLVIRTGIAGAKLAAEQWTCLSAFGAHLAAHDKFLSDDAKDLARRAVFGGPKGIVK